MDNEEYKTIREEMLSRFRWTFEIIFFSILSTSAILSWLILKKSEITDNGTNNLYLLSSSNIYILIGLGIVIYLFWFYNKTLKSIYNQGGYLVVFHELETKEFRWHTLNRFKNHFMDNLSILTKWGSDGRNAAILLLFLVIINSIGPTYILEGIFFQIDSLFLVIIAFWIISFYIFFKLLGTDKSMYDNVKNWLDFKDKMLKDNLFSHTSEHNRKLEGKIKEFLKN